MLALYEHNESARAGHCVLMSRWGEKIANYPEHRRRKAREAYWARREESLAKHKRWRDKPEVAVRLREKARQWKEENRARASMIEAERRLLTSKATLKTADREAMLLFYAVAQQLTRSTGIHHAVDHIVPIRGKNVCGLNVEWNLRLMTRAANISKHNRLPHEADLICPTEHLPLAITRAQEKVIVCL